MPRRNPVLAAVRSTAFRPIVTWVIIALNVVVFGLQNLPGSQIDVYGVYRPVLTLVEPWTMLTSLFLHASIIHILFNMYSLYILGPLLEQMLGKGRFVALYLVGGFGGSVAVLLLDPSGGVLGASGAIFGLLGAFFIIQRHLGGNNVQILIVIAINLAMGFFLSGISWQAHVGGLVVGCLVALIFVRTRAMAQRNTQILLVAGLVVALIAVTVVRAITL